MKKIVLFLFVLSLLWACGSKTKDVAAFEFDGAWYWVYNYESGTTEEELKECVKTYSNPNQTSYFFFYPDSVDVSIYASKPFSLNSFSRTILGSTPQPSFGFYKMPNDTKVYDDAVWLLEQSLK